MKPPHVIYFNGQVPVVIKSPPQEDERLGELCLYAWVGEDEFGSGEIGLKQGIVPAGCIPLVALNRDRMLGNGLTVQLQAQAKKFGKTIYLCKFAFAEVIETVGSNDGVKAE